MRMRWLGGGLVLILLLGLAGCRRAQVEAPQAAPEDTATHLGDKIDVSLADWLKLPRPELAKLVEEWIETVRKQRDFARGNVESVQLLPQLRPPALPVAFADAHYSPAAGFSLPPYLKEGQKDTAVALHLARFGDREAALKLADPADAELLARIDTYRTEHEYPVEWVRLSGLVLENAQLKLAGGELDGATELVLLHRQLRELLDAKAATGPLGAALLPRGKQALTLAAAAWREPRFNKTALAADIDAALAEWGTLPDPLPGLVVGAKQTEVERLFGRPAEGGAVLAPGPLAVQRTLDLLALPLPAEGARGVVAFLGREKTLAQLLVVYRPKINEILPEPKHLAFALAERGSPEETPAARPGLDRRTWTAGGLTYDVSLLTRGNAGGAIITVGKAGAPAPAATFARNPRDFGAVNLDRSFEQNRLGLVPDQTGSPLEIKTADKLTQIAQPAAAYPLSAALLQGEPNDDLLAKLTLRWPAEEGVDALSRLALPIWAAYGPAAVEGQEEAGGEFVLTWADGTTRLKLRLSFDEKAPEFVAEDARGKDGLPARREATAQLDRREREQRLSDGKPRVRLSRSLKLPSHGIDDLRLGLTREQVRTTLPALPSMRVQPLADGLNVLFLNEPPTTATYWPRQLFVRFGPDKRVDEIRVRYQNGPRASGKSAPSLLDTLRAKPNGAPETLSPPWAGLWTDLPARKPGVSYRWRDDATCLTYQSDRGGSEVVLRDCPKDQPLGVALLPLTFCGRGVEGLNLGDSRAEVTKHWKGTRPLLVSNGAEMLVLPANSPYDVLLVWYDNDKVSRLIARHREPKTLKGDVVGVELQKAWGRDIDRLGYLRRQDGPQGLVSQAYSYHDDRTRVRLFAQETEAGLRLFTEWREWPIPAQSVAAK